MKDIDFDELDRAVSSVLGTKETDKSADKKDVAQTPAVAPATEQPKPRETEQIERPATQDAPTRDEVIVKRPVIAAKRRGRFMDVVHPAGGQPVRPVQPSRVGKPIIAPQGPIEPIEQAPVAVEPVAELDETTVKIGAEPEPVTTPDEKDEQKLLEAVSEDTTDTLPVEETSEPAAKPLVAPTTLEQSIPSESPFLTDTKVDKRPLGGNPVAVTEQQGTRDTEADASEALPTMPRELQPDVVEAEVGDMVSAPSKPSNQSAAEATNDMPFATGVDPAPEPSDDGRVEGHPLFDTSTYHEPIKPANATSGMPSWLKWVLGLLICLVLGAGVGYLLFTAGF